jgi:hypothetical protein
VTSPASTVHNTTKSHHGDRPSAARKTSETITVPPVVDIPLSAAVEELTGFEVIAVESYFHTDFQNLGGMKTLIGAVWVYGNRDGRTMDWNAAKGMTLKQMQGYFAPEPDDPLEDEPDSEVGKGS